VNTIMKVAVTANEMASLKKRESATDQTNQQISNVPRSSAHMPQLR